MFSRTTYGDAAVEDIAAECGMAATSVYYHFGTKEELFDQAFESCLGGLGLMFDQAPVAGDAHQSDPRATIRRGWIWCRTRPAESRFLALHLNGATPQSRRRYSAWQELQARRAFGSRNSRRPRRQDAQELLAIQLISALLPIAQAALVDGPLSRLPASTVEDTLAELLAPILLDGPESDHA